MGKTKRSIRKNSNSNNLGESISEDNQAAESLTEQEGEGGSTNSVELGTGFQPVLTGGSADKNRDYRPSLSSPGKRSIEPILAKKLTSDLGSLADRWEETNSSEEDDWLGSDPEYETSGDDGVAQPSQSTPGAMMKWIRKHRRIPKVLKHKHRDEGSVYLLGAWKRALQEDFGKWTDAMRDVIKQDCLEFFRREEFEFKNKQPARLQPEPSLLPSESGAIRPSASLQQVNMLHSGDIRPFPDFIGPNVLEKFLSFKEWVKLFEAKGFNYDRFVNGWSNI